MENIELILYKSLMNFNKTTTLGLMRSNDTLLDLPGYKITEMLHNGVKEGYVECVEGTDKMRYSVTEKCRDFFEEIEAKKRRKAEFEACQARRKKRKAKAVRIAIASIVGLIFAVGIAMEVVIIPNNKYNDAIDLMSNGKYKKAIELFEEIDGHKDSKEKIKECNTLILEEKYNGALQHMNAGKYRKALSVFRSLNYKDSADKAAECLYKKQMLSLKNTNVGDYINFGEYEQDDDSTNGKEEIEWLVLKKEGNKFLLISKNSLGEQPYNSSREYVTWETCSLRAWLNNEFYATAFSTYHSGRILTSRVTADVNPAVASGFPAADEDVVSGNDTKDKIFLLSIPEAEKLFTTDFFEKPSAWVQGMNSRSWWLRTPGFLAQELAAYVYACGDGDGTYYWEINNLGEEIDHDLNVRPVMWITIE